MKLLKISYLFRSLFLLTCFFSVLLFGCHSLVSMYCGCSFVVVKTQHYPVQLSSLKSHLINGVGRKPTMDQFDPRNLRFVCFGQQKKGRYWSFPICLTIDRVQENWQIFLYPGDVFICFLVNLTLYFCFKPYQKCQWCLVIWSETPSFLPCLLPSLIIIIINAVFINP